MSNETALVQLGFSHAPIAFTESAENARVEALVIASDVEDVTDADTQLKAVNAQKAIRKLLNDVERSRKVVKEPILEAGRKLDAAVAEFSSELKAHELRIATLVGNYQQAELEKARKAEQAAAAERERIEREQREAVEAAQRAALEAQRIAEAKAAAERAAAKNDAELAAADARALAAQADAATRLAAETQRQAELAAQQLEAAPVVTRPAKVAGQTVREEWEIEEINAFLLLKSRPDLVSKIEFDRIAIKGELNRGLTLPGVKARKVIKSSVRQTAQTVIQL